MGGYRKGLFLNILSSNPADWDAGLRRLQGFSSPQHLELWLEYIPTATDRRLLSEMLRGAELLVHGPFIHTSLVSHLDELTRASTRRFNEAIEFAAFIGAKVVTFHAGTYPMFEAKEYAFDKLAQSFSTFVNLKLPAITLENMPVKNGTTKQCLGTLNDLRTFRTILPDVRFTLDIGHSLQNGDDFDLFLRENLPAVENIHLHDGIAGGRSHLRIGAGALDLGRLINLLRQLGFCKFVGLETISPEDTRDSWRVWMETEEKIES